MTPTPLLKLKVIGPKKEGVLRVCVFGESMAAGFPLAPAFSPSIVLEAILRESRAVEVIDLAMQNMGPSDQLRVAEAAQQLEPDVCVFMTGNNWYYGLSVEPTAPPEVRAKYAECIEQGGYVHLRESFREQLVTRAQVMLKALAGSALAAGAKPIVVIPPANHDWERRHPPPWLGEGKTVQWFESSERAIAALEAKDFERALQEGEAMEGLDENTTGTGSRICARALFALGRPAEARDAAVRAIDAANWQNYSWALPQTPSYVADCMRDRAAEFGYRCLDLEPVFAEHTGSPFLDFRMFYDHCHLSIEGTQVAMAAVAADILGTERSALLPRAPRPLDVFAAGAAFQSAHWLSQFYPELTRGDLQGRIEASLRSAVNLDAGVAEVMKQHIAVKSLDCSPALNAITPAASRFPGIASSLLSTRLNAAFVQAMSNVLGDELDEHVIGSYQRELENGIDVGHPKFRDWFWESTPIAGSDPHERQGSPFYRAWWPESRFSFITDASEGLEIDIDARGPVGPVTVTANENQVGSFDLSPGWRRHHVVLEKSALQRGINHITLHWGLAPSSGPSGHLLPAGEGFACNSIPLPPGEGAAKRRVRDDESRSIRNSVDRFRAGADGGLFPVFGEVFSMRVRRFRTVTGNDLKIGVAPV